MHSSLAISRSAIDAIEKEGFESWLDRQTRTANASTSTKFLKARGYDEIDTNEFWRRDYFFDYMIWAELLSGGNVVRKRMALSLSEIFVVSINQLDIVWPVQAVGAYWDLLNKHAFGNFRELLEVVTLNPAMSVFLDTRGNQKADPSTGRKADENYAREVMQLFTIGLFELNQDGSRRLSSGSPIETYDNEDVVGLAKVFTGYDFDYSGVALNENPTPTVKRVPDAQLVRQPITSDPAKWEPKSSFSTHSMEEKRFLGVTIAPGTGPRNSLKIALDRLFEHPNVGPFFGKQLIQRLVTSNPSPDYIGRVAGVFANNGQGVRGDLRAVFKAVVQDPEARAASGPNDPRFGKLREPILRYAQWGQTFNAASPSGNWQIRNLSEPKLLNQAPFRSPSVFNFFRPEYSPPRSQAAANDLLAPEFQLVNESSVAGYSNFMRQTVEGTGYWTEDIEPKYSYELSIANVPKKLLDHLDLMLSGGQLSSTTRDLILSALEDVKIDSSDEASSRAARVQIGVMLVMSCNDYLVQK